VAMTVIAQHTNAINKGQ